MLVNVAAHRLREEAALRYLPNLSCLCLEGEKGQARDRNKGPEAHGPRTGCSCARWSGVFSVWLHTRAANTHAHDTPPTSCIGAR